eukprot:COSAG02_NODE_2551_length_8553_cov_102.765673_5_plen_159_part_00
MSECGRARVRVCDLITKGLQQALLVVHTHPFVVALCFTAWRSYRPYHYEIVIDMQSDDSDTASGHNFPRILEYKGDRGLIDLVCEFSSSVNFNALMFHVCSHELINIIGGILIRDGGDDASSSCARYIARIDRGIRREARGRGGAAPRADLHCVESWC